MRLVGSNDTDASSTKTTINETLDAIESTLEACADDVQNPEAASRMHGLLLDLHAGIRHQHAQSLLHRDREQESPSGAAACASQLARLEAEHNVMFGMLDRIIRQCDSISALAPQEQYVIILRVRELIAFVRRHQAEEEFVFYRTVWRDVGGEG